MQSSTQAGAHPSVLLGRRRLSCTVGCRALRCRRCRLWRELLLHSQSECPLPPSPPTPAPARPPLSLELKGKLNGLAVRVPLLNASITDCVFEVGRPTSAEEVNALLKVGGQPCRGRFGRVGGQGAPRWL